MALGSAAYKGVLFSTTSQPGWKDARWLGGYLTNSAIAIGCAELLAIATLLGQDAAASALHPALVVLLAINLVFLGLVAAELRPAMLAVGGWRAAANDRRRWCGSRAWSCPLCLVLCGSWARAGPDRLVSIVLGNFLVRWAIVMLPHRDPAIEKVHNRDGSL